MPAAQPRSRPFALHRVMPTFFRPSAADLALFARQLAVLLRTGIPLVPAMETLAEQASSPLLRDASYAARDDLVVGYSMSAALARQPAAFPRIFVDMVRAGEATGQLDSVLAQVARQLERSAAARRRIVGALLYPSLVIGVALVMVVVMTAFVLPAMAGLFREFATELPLPTRIVIGSAAAVREHGAAGALVLVALVSLALVGSRTRAGARFFDRAALAVPVLGSIVRDTVVERTTRTLGMLLGAGIPIAQALELVQDTTPNAVYRAHLGRVRERLLAGEGFAGPFSSPALFPPLVRQMVGVGERSGKLDQFLRDAADHVGEELETRIERSLTLIEPALTILVALVVGLVALAVIMPIYTLIGDIR